MDPSTEKLSSSILVPDWSSKEVLTGTTIMAVEFNGGVVIGADSRTTMGSYVANRVTDKLTPVTDRIYCCRSGSAADTQAITDVVKHHMDLLSLQLGEEPDVKAAAHIFKDVCYNNREQLSAGIICAGWDRKLGGQVYSIPIGGMLVRQPLTLGGSGSGYIYGYIDANYQTGMEQEDVVDLVKKAVALAMKRDGSSGGVIRIGIVTGDGIERRVFAGDQVPRFNED